MYGFSKPAGQPPGKGFTRKGAALAASPGDEGRDQLQAAASGPVRGPGSGTSDEVKTTVPEGSYIMPADSTRQIGEQKLAGLGFAAGKGKQTADDGDGDEGLAIGFNPAGGHVPVNLSNGEFKLSPEQVHAIGVQVLEGLKEATHVPVEKYEQAEPGEGEVQQPSRDGLFFADGGVVEDPAKRPGLATSPSNTYPGNQAERAGNIYAKSNADMVQAGPDAAGFLSRAFPGTATAIQGAGQAIQDAYKQGGIGAAVGQGFRGAMVPAVGLADDVMSSAGKVLDPAANALKTFVTGDSTPIGQAAAPASAKPAQPAAASTAAAIPATPSSPDYGNEPNAPGNPASVSSGGSNPSVAAPVGADTSVPGVRRINQPGQAPLFTNVGTGGAAAPAQPAGFSPRSAGQNPDVMGILQRESQIRNEMTPLRDQIAFNSGAGGAFRKLGTDEIVRDMLANGNSRDRAAVLGFMAGGRDAGMRQQRDQQELNLRQQEVEGRQDLAGQELGIKREAQGFQTRAAQRQEALQARYEAAKTPEERAAIAQQIRDLSGKTESPKDNFMVVGGGQEWDASAGAMRNVPQRLIDLRSGREAGSTQQPPNMPADKAQRKAGMVYTLGDGRRVKWDGTGAVEVN